MLDAISRFFRKEIAVDDDPDRDPGTRLRVATCALLLEAAHADDDFSSEERNLVEKIATERFQLTRQQAAQLIELADSERRQSSDLYQFTRLISESFDRAEKLTVLKELWQIVYSDGRLEAHEDALLHKLANLLGLKHKELIALKLQVKSSDEGGQS